MTAKRTPEPRFRDLPDFPYAPRYVEVQSADGPLRMHYVQTGPASAPVVLCLHGQPTWSYLYRKVMPPLAAAGLRVVAPDLIGFGRSDKPTAPAAYTYAAHVAWVRTFIDALALRDITLVCQDWGGLIGLRIVADAPDRFARVVATNTGLPDGSDVPAELVPRLREQADATPLVVQAELASAMRAARGMGRMFVWRRFCAEAQHIDVGGIVDGAVRGGLSAAERAAYNAPFPDESYLSGVRRFPSLVPLLPDDPGAQANRRAWRALATFDRPFLTAFTDRDPITRGGDRRMRSDIPGCAGIAPVTIEGAGHFVQEERGPELARLVAAFAQGGQAS